jgi:hypothetical protein
VKIVKQAEPPSPSQVVFLVGRNSRGHWVAQDRNGLYGGLFVSHAAAVSYAMFENGHNPAAVISTPDIIELQIFGRPSSSAPHCAVDGGEAVRQAA